jgi:ribose transport system substrate-binding protein
MFRLHRARIAGGVVALAVMAAMIAGYSSSASASTSSTSSTSGKIRMAIFYYNPSPYGIASLKGAQEEAAKLGVQLDAFDGDNNPTLQSTQIQDAITTGKYKAFWVWGLDDPALTPVIDRAIAAHIKVACADYTWGTLAQQNTLRASKTCLTTIGQPIGAEATNLEITMNAACKKAVGSGHCNIAFLPGLDNYPTDTVREDAMTAYYKTRSQYTFTLMPPGDYDETTSEGVAQTYFTANKNVNVFATFGDQMAAGAMTAMKIVGGYTPGKNIEVIGYGGAKELVELVKSGAVYATLGLYPASESLLGIQYLYDALKGKSVPNVVDILNPVTRPAIIDQAYLKAHPKFVPDWTLEGGIG